jgi:hypothetical protein
MLWVRVGPHWVVCVLSAFSYVVGAVRVIGAIRLPGLLTGLANDRRDAHLSPSRVQGRVPRRGAATLGPIARFPEQKNVKSVAH